MDRSHVATFYRGKGYLVHESIVVTGQSGNQQRVPLLCEGPLGNLAVFFGDAGGIDGPEIGAAKRVARDLGATAVLAAGTFTGEQRGHAAELGVVLLDDAAMGAPVPTPSVESAWPGHTPRANLARDLAAHPWPSSGRADEREAAHTAGLAGIDVVGTLRARAAPAPPVASAPATPTATARARSDGGGLWKHGRGTPVAPTVQPATAGDAILNAAANPAPARTAAATGRFAWLDLPKPAPAAAELEVDVPVTSRKTATAEEREAARLAALHRDVTRRRWLVRGTWLLGAALLVYLFVIWWT